MELFNSEFGMVRAVFDWPKDMGPDCWIMRRFKKKMENVLIDFHNRFSEHVNKHIDEWNARAEALGLTENLPSGPEWYDTKYVSFMWDRYMETIIEMIFDESLQLPKGTDVYVGDELELHLVIKDCFWRGMKAVDLSFSLQQVEA